MPVVYQPGPANWYADMREAYRPFDLETPRLYAQKPAFAPASLRGLGTTDWGATAKAYLPWVLVGGAVALAIMMVMRMTGRSTAIENWPYGDD
jgi:hypothetical protein